MQKRNGFFAYNTNPKYSNLEVKKSISEIHRLGITRLKTWRQYTEGNTLGSLSIYSLMRAIDNSHYFCADLTGFSEDVLFELGYAISKRKPIFLTIDFSYSKAQDQYSELLVIKNLERTRYIDHKGILKGFLNRAPYVSDRQSNILSRERKGIRISESQKAVLFLKNQADRNFSHKISEKISAEGLSQIVDDPEESPMQPLSWYIEQIYNTSTVIAEFSKRDEMDYDIQNAKCALICGLAIGLGKHVLMVAEEAYENPIDYQDILVKPRGYEIFESTLVKYLQVIKKDLISFSQSSNIIEIRRKRRSLTELQNTDFGRWIAEQEFDYLAPSLGSRNGKVSRIYCKIFNLRNLSRSSYNIVIGRKGVGKTATLYSLWSLLEGNSNNIVCIIEPQSSGVKNLLAILEEMPNNYDKSYLVESVWKFIIYVQLAIAVQERIKINVIGSYSKQELIFLDFIKKNQEIFVEDLSDSFEAELQRLVDTKKAFSPRDFKVKISEMIHSDTIATIRDNLVAVISSMRKDRIIALIDNLDAAWGEEKTPAQSQWILGLLNVTKAIIRDLDKVGRQTKREKIDFSLTVFLRSDIFRYVIDKYREPDKIDYTHLRWEDEEALFEIIERRFVELNGLSVNKNSLWNDYIVDSVEGEPVKEFIYSRILPRPRDLIYFFSCARESATKRDHSQIEEKDIKRAWEDYSAWLFDAVVKEMGVAIPNIDGLLNRLLISDIIFERETLYDCMKKAGVIEDGVSIDSKEVDFIIDYLVSASFIGREVSSGKFEYEYDFSSDKLSKFIAEQMPTQRYRLHAAFIPKSRPGR